SVLGVAANHRAPGRLVAWLPRRALLATCAIQLSSVCPGLADLRRTAAGARSARDLAGRASSARTVATAPGLAADGLARRSCARSKWERAELESRSPALLDLCCAPGARIRGMGGALAGRTPPWPDQRRLSRRPRCSCAPRLSAAGPVLRPAASACCAEPTPCHRLALPSRRCWHDCSSVRVYVWRANCVPAETSRCFRCCRQTSARASRVNVIIPRLRTLNVSSRLCLWTSAIQRP